MSDLPATANAWIVTANKGGFEALKSDTRPVPKVEAHEVLVKMRAVSLNYRDLVIPQGLYPFRTSTSQLYINPTDRCSLEPSRRCRL